MVADPALVTREGKVLIMGTGDTLSWSSLKDMISSKKPVSFQMRLFQEVDQGGQKKIVSLLPHEVPWDLQIYDFNGKQYLYGGVMTPPGNNPHARWPEDNISRRIKVGEFDHALNGWVFRSNPVFGKADHQNWTGHSYGQQIISYGNKKYLLHEEISSEGTTEIFIRKLSTPFKAGTAKKIIGINHLDLSATRRLDGGHLLEGPRYQKLVLSGRTLHLIYFSTGDFPTTNYATRVAYSFDHIEGPYKVITKNLTQEYAEINRLYGVGRAFPFNFEGKNMIIFHGAKMLPETNHNIWPSSLDNFRRCLFTAQVEFRLSSGNNLEINLIKN